MGQVDFSELTVSGATSLASVVSKKSLISITFLTYSDEFKLPIEDLESTAIKIPSLNLKASVVVPILSICKNTFLEVHYFFFMAFSGL